ncbi:MAG: serine/threonine protein kinase, partial [Planctomycetaceae bacterium]|nr:serine/threonine protein kinase [Planctomycetaceae bacterium]
MSEPESQSSEKTSVDTFASDDLIPHPSTDAAAVPELTGSSIVSGTLPVGTVLGGNYTIEGFIGGGGMGRVYLATDTALDRKVAVKILPKKRAGEQSTVARFLNEAKSAARLNHEHIAQVYFTGEHLGLPYIVFEYVEGTNVRTLINENEPFPLPQALNYLIQIAHALAHAAEHGVIHRDVKPSNILITPEGRAKLIDMGLARLLDPSEVRDDLTASGVTLGTFDYISPEQARDPRAADIRSDIYSLGCTFFFMLAGRPPFPEGTVLQKLLQHQGDEPPDIRAFQPKIPAEAALLIQKMMAKDPRQRFQTPEALIKALVQVAEMTGLQPAGPGKLVWVMPNMRQSSVLLKHLPWFASVGVLLLGFALMSIASQHKGLEIPEFSDEEYDSALPPLMAKEPESSPPAPEVKREKASLAAVFHSEPYSENGLHKQLPFLYANPTGIKPASLSVLPDGKRTGAGIGSAGGIAGRLNTVFSRTVAPPMPFVLSVLTQPSAAPAAVPNLCVDPTGGTPGAYKSISAALADVGNKADKQTVVIELKWNNAVRTEPLTFTGKNVRFTAAKGYYPVLLFEPSETDTASSRSRN